MEGYLKKWVNFMYQWQNRYFILHEDSLIYCQSKGTPKKGQVHLSICSIRSVPKDPQRIVINYGMSEMHLRASSVQEKQKWLDALLNAQQRFTSKSQNKLLVQRKKNPFYFIEGAPELDLKRIHTTLTQFWVMQAQLEEQISLNNTQRISQLIQELKHTTTACAQELDEEYNKLIEISKKLQEKLRETNDQNPPDHDDLYEEEFVPTEQFMSFKMDEDEFYSINNELYDDRQLVRRLSSKKMSVAGVSPLFHVLEQLRIPQPIKYKNLINNEAFKDMIIGIDETREQLPAFKDPNESIKFVSLLKDMIGKDLTKIAFPVTFNEPLSMLQNLCENLEYSEILDQADSFSNSCERLAYVMVFAASGLSATINRVKKPFNPILGETFEFACSKFKYISEQVSHHPPISVGYAENEHFEFLSDNNVTTSFWGKSITVTPLGWVNIKLKKNQDQIAFQRCKSSFKNLIMGPQYLDHYGEMKFKNEVTGDTGILKLIEGSSEASYELKGFVKDKLGTQYCTIQGKWNSEISITVAGTMKVVWVRNALPQKSDQQYYFTRFALQLNHLNRQLLKTLPPTDSRLRPDQRALENSNIDFAAIEKTRLEQKQRLARKELHEQKKDHSPKWFIQRNGKYSFGQEYWKAKETPEFQTQAFDIF
ncbi:unnamed protein product [Paramecium primaurelia]|uniref:PH domain-containing protein n=1 Tax=Paramecium primaurelia TaxID=5886 RepID=A0A8S1MJT9_PARPR|nr:unnamed protein product [Paramecium primaurelia]